MTEPVLACPLCGDTASQPFDRRTFRGVEVVNRLCTGCGLVFQSPRMSDEELSNFYAAEYRQLYQGSAGPNSKDLAVQTRRAQALLDFAAGRIAKPTIYLDIGCSAGKLLEQFGTAFGCRTVGIEPGEAYRLDDQRRGLEVYPSLETLEQTQPARFDLISLIHVLEHLPHPVEYLTHLRENLLQPGGWLLLEVPNLYSHDSFEIAHLWSFSAHTLTQTVRRAGFEVVALNKHGSPLSRLLPLYLTLLARPLPAAPADAVLSERAVRLKRRSGMLWRRLLQRLFPALAWVPRGER